MFQTAFGPNSPVGLCGFAGPIGRPGASRFGGSQQLKRSRWREGRSVTGEPRVEKSMLPPGRNAPGIGRAARAPLV